MLAQRLQRWPNIKTSLFQHVLFAGKLLQFSFLHGLQKDNYDVQ